MNIHITISLFFSARVIPNLTKKLRLVSFSSYKRKLRKIEQAWCRQYQLSDVVVDVRQTYFWAVNVKILQTQQQTVHTVLA